MRGFAVRRVMPDEAPAESRGEAPVRLPGSGGHLPDGELVARATEGQAWAEEVLYRRYADLVIGLSRRLLGSREDSLDVAQDAFLTAFEKLPSLRDGDTFKTWLLQIAVRHVHRRFRRKRLLSWVGLGDAEAEGTLESLAASGAPLDVLADLHRVDSAVQTLSPALRIPWLLRHVEGHEVREIAALCGYSLATAKRRIAAAEERMARRLNDPDPGRRP